jgi:hypothetical protein
MDTHTCTGGRIKVPRKGVPRSTPSTEKVNGKNQQSKEMNADSAEEDISQFGLYYISWHALGIEKREGHERFP